MFLRHALSTCLPSFPKSLQVRTDKPAVAFCVCLKKQPDQQQNQNCFLSLTNFPAGQIVIDLFVGDLYINT